MLAATRITDSVNFAVDWWVPGCHHGPPGLAGGGPAGGVAASGGSPCRPHPCCRWPLRRRRPRSELPDRSKNRRSPSVPLAHSHAWAGLALASADSGSAKNGASRVGVHACSAEARLHSDVAVLTLLERPRDSGSGDEETARLGSSLVTLELLDLVRPLLDAQDPPRRSRLSGLGSPRGLLLARSALFPSPDATETPRPHGD